MDFARAARGAGIHKIVYLGGLGSGDALSAHLKSRQEVGRILKESGVPTLEFRAAVVIGAGSLSFEMVRALVNRLPVMVTPRWVRTPTQPIAADDLLDYLVAALDDESPEEGVFEIGGADRTSYLGIMKEYARVGRELIEGVRNPTVVEDHSAMEAFPVRPMGIRAALARAGET